MQERALKMPRVFRHLFRNDYKRFDLNTWLRFCRNCARGGPHIVCITTTEYGVEARLLQNTKWRRGGASIGSRRIASISPARSSVSGAAGASCTGHRDDYLRCVSPTLKIFVPTASSTRASRMLKTPLA